MAQNPLQHALAAMMTHSTSFQASVHVPTTKKVLAVLSLLYREGYIAAYSTHAQRTTVFLKYTEDRVPALKKIQLISTPGREVVITHKSLCLLPKQVGNLILETDQGILTLDEARNRYRIGGKVLFKIL